MLELTDQKIHSVANGTYIEEWEKEKLGKHLIQSVLTSEVANIEHLKDCMFKVMECTWKPSEKEKWPQVSTYSDEEKYENASLFCDKHYEGISNGGRGIFATVSSTCLIVTEENELFFYERIYDHISEGVVRERTETDKEIENLLCSFADILK